MKYGKLLVVVLVWQLMLVQDGFSQTKLRLLCSTPTSENVHRTNDGSHYVYVGTHTIDVYREWDYAHVYSIREFKRTTPLFVNSPSGKLMTFVQNGSESKVQVYNVENGNVVFTVPNVRNASCAAISPDDKNLVLRDNGVTILYTMSTGDTVRLSPIENYQSARYVSDSTILFESNSSFCLYNLKTNNYITTNAYSAISNYHAQSNRIALVTNSGYLEVYDLSTATKLLSTYHYGANCTAISFDQTGSMLITGGVDGVLRFWRMPSGELIKSSSKEKGSYNTINFSKDSSLVAFSNGVIQVWNAKTLDFLYKIPASNLINFSNDSKMLIGHVYRDFRTYLQYFDAKTGALLGSKTVQENINSFDIDTNNNIYAGGVGGSSLKFTVDSAILKRFVPGYILRPRVECSYDGRQILHDNSSYSHTILPSDSAPDFSVLPTNSGGVSDATINKSANQCATFAGKTLNVLHTLTREILFAADHKSTINAVSFSPSGTKCAVAIDSSILIYNTTTWQVERTVRAAYVADIVWLRNEKNLLVASTYTVRVQNWDIEKDSMLFSVKNFNVHWVQHAALAINPANTVFVSASPDGSILRDLFTGELIATLSNESRVHYFAEFSKDGKLILTGGPHNEVEFWNAKNGEKYNWVIGDRYEYNNQARFSNDSKKVIALLNNGVIGVWELPNTTDVEEQKQNTQLQQPMVLHSISPMPTASTITCTIETQQPQQVQIEVYDLLGQTVVPAFIHTMQSNIESVSVDVASLNSGTYTMVLRSAIGSTSKQFVVAK